MVRETYLEITYIEHVHNTLSQFLVKNPKCFLLLSEE